jgi:hypothetical protein
VRIALALTLVALAGAMTAVALPRAVEASNPELIGTVNDDYTITLTDSGGTAVTSLAAGTYDIAVHDNSAIHNFDLKRPDGTTADKTSIPTTGDVTWTITLTPGTWTFVCDAHAFMSGNFTVTATTTSSAASTSSPATTAPVMTTAPVTTTSPTTTAAVAPQTPTTPPLAPPKPSPCIVPGVVGRTLATGRRLLRGAGCTTGRLSRAHSARLRRGRILSQRPAPGARRAHGAPVALVVSRGASTRSGTARHFRLAG